MESKAERRHPFELLERTRVELLDELTDRGVELAQAEKGPVAQRRDDPSLHDQHSAFDLRLVLRLARARRDHRHAVVLRHLEVRRIDVGLVAVRPRDCAAKLIGHDDLRERSRRTRTHARSTPTKSGSFCVRVASAYV